MSEPLFTNIEQANLSRAFRLPLDLGNGAPNAHYFRTIDQISVTAASEIQISLTEPKAVFSVLATHAPTVDVANRTVTCDANSLVPAAIHSDARDLLPAWSILGANRVVYTIDDGALTDLAAATAFNQIADSVTRFKFKFIDASGQVIPNPVTILRAISRFNGLFSGLILYAIVKNDPAQDSTSNKFQPTQTLISGWPASSWSIAKILTDEKLLLDEYFSSEMVFLNPDADRTYRDAVALTRTSFRDLARIADLASFESQLVQGVVAYVHTLVQPYYLIIYDAATFTVDMIHIARASNVRSTVDSLRAYTTIINGPVFVETSVPVRNPTSGAVEEVAGAKHVGARKFASTHDGMPTQLPSGFSEWNVTADFEDAFKGKLIVDVNGDVSIRRGDLTDADLRDARCATDALRPVIVNGTSQLDDFKEEVFGWYDTNGLSCPFIGDFTKGGRRFLFVLIKQNETRKNISCPDSFPVYEQMFTALGAQNVVHTDASDSATLFHGNFDSGPFEGNYSKVGRSKQEHMPALIGIRRR